MKSRGMMRWVPLAIVVGCNAKVIEVRDDPNAGKNQNGHSDVEGGTPGTNGAGGDMTTLADGSVPLGGTTGAASETSRGGARAIDAHSGASRIASGSWVGIGGDTSSSSSSSGGYGATHGPHCRGVPSTCGEFYQWDCCRAFDVPGGTFLRDGAQGPSDEYDFVNPDWMEPDGGANLVFATVSDFSLDESEVTVARFRQFVLDQQGHAPAAGSGKNPNNPMDPGWDSSWNDSFLAVLSNARRAELTQALNCKGMGTWQEAPSEKLDDVPINCLDWYEAYAFCIWDGGRLPTETEWHYAAEGGSEGRHYPWGSSFMGDEIDKSYAVYSPYADRPKHGGDWPKGDGKWGHVDLAGNVAEWLRDGSSDATHAGYYPTTCNDCINDFNDGRQTAGGSFLSDAAGLYARNRSSADAETRLPGVGVRCARRHAATPAL